MLSFIASHALGTIESLIGMAITYYLRQAVLAWLDHTANSAIQTAVANFAATALKVTPQSSASALMGDLKTYLAGSVPGAIKRLAPTEEALTMILMAHLKSSS